MGPTLEEILRTERGRVVATLRRLTGDLDRAEDAVSEAVLEAIEQWPTRGMPERPAAWLTTVARRRALDRIRREAQRGDRERAAVDLVAIEAGLVGEPEPVPWSTVRDDQLRLIFTCCHPALSPEARVALALRTLCGLTTVEIARVTLVPDATMGQRISRAKAKIAAAKVPYRIPGDAELPDRLPAVLAVVQTVFTVGHHAPVGDELVRVDLCVEAIRLARLLVELMPDEPECVGLLALLVSTHARSSTRLDDAGEPVLLDDADRSRWDHDATAEATALLQLALRRGRVGPYQLRAAISCLHSGAPSAEATDWPQIVVLYRQLEAVEPSVVVRVNRAVAEAQVGGPEVGLALLDAVGDRAEAARWHLFHSTRAALLADAERVDDAVDAYRRAIELADNDVDRRFLSAGLAALVDHREP